MVMVRLMIKEWAASRSDSPAFCQTQGLDGPPRLELARYKGVLRRIHGDFRLGGANEVGLIRPSARAIPLIGREKERESFRGWRGAQSPISVRVLTGGAGLGKTRLAMELVEEAAEEGWHAGFLSREALWRFLEKADVAGWEWDRPQLVVIDDAAASSSGLNELLRLLAEHRYWGDLAAGPERPLRLLLLERHATRSGGWWAGAFGSHEEAVVLERMLDPAEPVVLRTLDEPSVRLKIFEETLNLLLDSPVIQPDGGDLENRLAALTWGGVPLLLMMAAAYAARNRNNVGEALALGADELAAGIAEGELSRVRRVVEGCEVGPNQGAFVDHMVAVATLCQGLTPKAALDAIKAEAADLGYELTPGPEALRDALATALPGGAEEEPELGAVGAVRPDVVGEALLLAVWGGRNEALPALRRAHEVKPVAVMETLVRTCQNYLIHGERDPLTGLREVLKARNDVDSRAELLQAIPEDTVELRGFALEVAKSVVSMLESRAGDSASTEERARYAGSVNALSFRLSAAGRRVEALERSRQAVELYEELVERGKDSKFDPSVQAGFRPELASALNDLSARLSAMGHRKEALEAVSKAVCIRRDLAALRPSVFRSDLAESLSNESNRLSALGRHKEALKSAGEALKIRRDLDRRRPDLYGPGLARSLKFVSIHRATLGLRKKAEDAAREAVGKYRGLVASCRDAYLPELAAALDSLSNRLADVGEHEEALKCIREAVSKRFDLKKTLPDAFDHEYATSLTNYSERLSDLGQREKALEKVDEAVDLFRGLASRLPDAFRPDLAWSLNCLSSRLSDAGRRREALRAAEEAVKIQRELTASFPGAFEARLAKSLNSLSNRLSEVGRPEKALQAIEEAVKIRRKLVTSLPGAFESDLAVSLNNRSKRLLDLGRSEEALEAVREGVEIRRRLVNESAAVFRSDLAWSLNSLSDCLAAMGRRQEALEQAREAVKIRRKLARALPDAFRPQLAASLNNLAGHLSVLGRLKEAHRVAEETEKLYGGLADACPGAFSPDHAGCLNNLSNVLLALGRREEALDHVESAVALHRGLAKSFRHAFLPDLAGSLNNLSVCLAELGRLNEAIHAATEALMMYEEMAADRPDGFLPDLAVSSCNVSSRLAEAGRKEQALKHAREAVALCCELAAIQGGVFRPDLVAAGLHNLSKRLADVGREDEALARAEEAVSVYREMAVERSDVVRPYLAAALHSWSERLSDVGRRSEARGTAQQAALLYNEFAATDLSGSPLLQRVGPKSTVAGQPTSESSELHAAARWRFTGQRLVAGVFLSSFFWSARLNDPAPGTGVTLTSPTMTSLAPSRHEDILSQIKEEALELWGRNRTAAQRFLERPSSRYAGLSPLEMANQSVADAVRVRHIVRSTALKVLGARSRARRAEVRLTQEADLGAVVAAARELMGDQNRARVFLDTPHSMLEGRTPREFAAGSQEGAASVLRLVNKIRDGIPA